MSAEQIVDRGDVAIALGHIKGTGAGSGANVGVPLALVIRFRDGLIVRGEEYLDPDEARRAA
jgi:ketosteroid isomerase-like protein